MTPRSQLAAAELAVMKLLWTHEALTARQILEEVYPDASRSQHGTVQRLLQRLEDKGFVRRDRDQPVQLFRAVVTQQDYIGAELESLADQLTDGSLAPLVTLLVEGKKLSRSDLKRLKRLVEEL